MSAKALDGAAREHTREIEKSDGLGAALSRAGAAVRRDLAAADRDSEASARDRLALAADSDEGSAGPSRDRQRQERSARDRESAAGDRVEASLDRAQAAVDRTLSSEAIGVAARDDMTGAMSAGFGLAALQREIDRSERTGESLLVAFVAADAADQVGDGPEEPPGSQALRDVAECLVDDLRDYDLVARMGPSGFVCAQAGQTISRATVRYGEVANQLATRPSGARMTVGLLELNSGESLETLVDRGNLAMS